VRRRFEIRGYEKLSFLLLKKQIINWLFIRLLNRQYMQFHIFQKSRSFRRNVCENIVSLSCQKFACSIPLGSIRSSKSISLKKSFLCFSTKFSPDFLKWSKTLFREISYSKVKKRSSKEENFARILNYTSFLLSR